MTDRKADSPYADRLRDRRAKEQENREGILRRHFKTNGVPHMAPDADSKD